MTFNHDSDPFGHPGAPGEGQRNARTGGNSPVELPDTWWPAEQPEAPPSLRGGAARKGSLLALPRWSRHLGDTLVHWFRWALDWRWMRRTGWRYYALSLGALVFVIAGGVVAGLHWDGGDAKASLASATTTTPSVPTRREEPAPSPPSSLAPSPVESAPVDDKPTELAELVVDVVPRDASVYVSPRSGGSRVRHGGPWPRSLELAPADYDVTATRRYYRPARRFVTVAPKGPTRVRLRLAAQQPSGGEDDYE
jgi:hypothetical protein